MNKFLSDKNIKIIEDYTKIIGKVGLLTSAMGAILQYLNLILIGKGSWILSYYSLTYILFEGLHYTFYFILIMIFIESIGNWFEKNTLHYRKTYKIILGISIMLICYCLMVISKDYQIRIYTFPFIIMLLMIGILLILFSFQKNGGFAESDDYEFYVLDFLYMYVITIILLNMFAYFKPDGLLRDQTKFYAGFPVIKNEMINGEKIKKIYTNDNYVFVRFKTKEGESKIFIKEISNLLDSQKNAVTIKPILKNK